MMLSSAVNQHEGKQRQHLQLNASRAHKLDSQTHMQLASTFGVNNWNTPGVSDSLLVLAFLEGGRNVIGGGAP